MLETAPSSRTKTMLIVGGILAALSVAAELVYPVQATDGTTGDPALHALYLAVWTVGWVLIAVAALSLRNLPSDGGRMATIGSWLLLGGALVFAVFGLAQVLGVLLGIDVEALFVLFLLAFPLVVIGFVLLGLGLRWAGGAAWILAFVAAAGFLLALLAEADPWHDIGLIGGLLAVSAFGLALRARGSSVATLRSR
jgi:hypothetical protein